MHTKKLQAAIFLAALVGASSFKVQGGDNDAQAKARELLRQKMAQLNGQAPSNAAPAAATPTPVPPPTAAQPAPTPSVSSDQAEKLRQALRQKLSEGNSQPAAPAVAAPATPPPPVVVIPPLATPPPPVAPTPAPAPAPAVSSGDEDKLRQALHQKMLELNSQPAPTVATPTPVAPPVNFTPAPAAPPVVATPAPAPQPVVIAAPSPAEDQKLRDALHKALMDQNAQAPAGQPMPPANSTSTMTPEQQQKLLEAVREQEAKQNAAEQAAKWASMRSGGKAGPESSFPPATVPGSKEQKLYDLLQLYKADKITPTEYHQQRAKIIAE